MLFSDTPSVNKRILRLWSICFNFRYSLCEATLRHGWSKNSKPRPYTYILDFKYSQPSSRGGLRVFDDFGVFKYSVLKYWYLDTPLIEN
jgi:hypothetical protein